MTMKAAYLLVDMAIVTQWRGLSEDDLIAALDAEEQKRLMMWPMLTIVGMRFTFFV